MEIIDELKKFSSVSQAKILQKFFKTGKGEYGEGDVFIGVKVPDVHSVAKKYFKDLSLKDIQILLNDKIHEVRLLGGVILVYRFKKANEVEKEKIYGFYLKNAKRFNNWDLVDLTSHKIVGEWLKDKDKKILYDLVKSNNLWERRIAVISCFGFIRENDFKDSLKICEFLLEDKHDLIHKAVGWMLREVGKRDKKILIGFLERCHKRMPRTALRYAIEKFDEAERKGWLAR